MFFVFNPIALVLCISVSIIFGVFLRRDLLEFDRDTESVAAFVMRMLVLGLTGFLAWLQMSVLMDIAFDKTSENIASMKNHVGVPYYVVDINIGNFSTFKLNHFQLSCRSGIYARHNAR